MKTTKRILSLLLAVALILSVAPMGLFTPASAATVSNASGLTSALSGADPVIMLTKDIVLGGVLDIPDGKTVDLNGHKLTVTNTTVASFGDGALADSSANSSGLVALKLGASSATNNLNYLDAVETAYQMPLVKRIELGGNVDTTAIATSTSGAPGSKDAAAARWTYAANKYVNISGTNLWIWAGVPDGVTLDLRGYGLTMRAATATTLNAGPADPNTAYVGSIVDTSGSQGGKVTFWAWSGGANSLSNAAIMMAAPSNNASKKQITVTANISGADANNNKTITIPENTILYGAAARTINLTAANSCFVFKSGATISGFTSIAATNGIIFECANEADLERAGIARATQVKLVADIELTKAINLGSTPIDYNYCKVTGNTITAGTPTNVPTAATTATAATDDELDAAMVAGATVSLTADITYDNNSGVLTIPADVRIDLNGHNLYVTKGLVNNGSPLLRTGGGKLWAMPSANGTTSQTSTSTLANMTNVWNAFEVLNQPGTELDGIKLNGAFTSLGNAGTDSNTSARFPNLKPLVGRQNSNKVFYFIPYIPEGKTLDLNGNTWQVYTSASSIGKGELINTSATAATLALFFNDSNDIGTYERAVAVATEHPETTLIKLLQYTKTNTLDYEDRAPVPANAQFAKSGETVANNVTFAVADEAGFTRTGTNASGINVAGFVLADNITLTDNVTITGKAFDFNGYTVSVSGGHSITAASYDQTKGGGYIATVVSESELTTAISNGYLAQVLLGDDFTLTDDADLTGAAFDFNGHYLSVTDERVTADSIAQTGGGGYIITVSDETELLAAAGTSYATKIVLANPITLTLGNADINGLDIDYAGNRVKGYEITNYGTYYHKPADALPNVATKEQLVASLDAELPSITLTATIDLDDVLDIPAGTTVELGNYDLYVTGLTGSGTLSKTGTGKLWANASTKTPIAAAVSAADVSNFWAAAEEILNPSTKFNGIRLTADLPFINSPLSDNGAAASTADFHSYLPLSEGTGAFVYNSTYGVSYVPQIPDDKTLDLNGHQLVIFSSASSFGDGAIIDSGVGGHIRIFYASTSPTAYNSISRAFDLVNSRPTVNFRLYQSGTANLSYAGYSIPTNAVLTINLQKKNGDFTATATDVWFEIKEESNFAYTITGSDMTTPATNVTVAGVKLMNNITLENPVSLDVDIDYDWKTVSGAALSTTGEEINKLTSSVGTPTQLQKAIEHELTSITLTADIVYGDVLEVPSGTTIDLNGNKLTVRNTTLASFGAGSIIDSDGEGMVAIKLTSNATNAKVEYLDAAEAAYQQGRGNNPNFQIKRIELSSNVALDTVAKSVVGEAADADGYVALAEARWKYAKNYCVYLTGNNFYIWPGVSAGITVDLGGYILSARALTTGTAVVPGIGIGAMENGTVQILAWGASTITLPNAVNILGNVNLQATKILKITTDLNTVNDRFNQVITIPENVRVTTNDDKVISLASNANSGFVFKSGATLEPGTNFSIAVANDITFEVANAADLTRAGIEYATKIVLVDDFELASTVDITAVNNTATFDFNGHYVSGATITAADYAQTTGGGYAITVTSDSALRTAIDADYVGKVIIGANVTLESNLVANHVPIEVAAGYTFSTGGYTLSKTVVTSGAPEYGNFDGVVAADEVYVADDAELDAAFDGAADVIKLSTTINYNAPLDIPFGKTVDLCGNDLYVTGYTCSGTLLRTGGGKLWANVSNNLKLEAIPSLADMNSNIWAANEMLLAAGSPLDGIRLVDDIETYAAAYKTVDSTFRGTRTPNLNTEGGFSEAGTLDYAAVRIPYGKTLDLNGHTFVMCASANDMGTNTQGTGTVVANGGHIELRIHNGNTYAVATRIAAAYPGVVTIIRHNNTTGSISAYNNTEDVYYAIPVGVTLATNGCTISNVIFEVASLSDFEREGTSSAKINVKGFTIKNNITLDGPLTLTNKDLTIGEDGLGNGYTLALNGYTLDLGTGTLATSFGFITDTSTDDNTKGLNSIGLIKAGTVQLANTARNLDITGLEPTEDDEVKYAYQPLYDNTAKGWRFFKIAENVRTPAAMTEDANDERSPYLTFKFIFNFANENAWDLVTTGESGMAFWFSLKYADSPSGAADQVLYYLKAEKLNAYAAAQKSRVGLARGKQSQLIAKIWKPYFSERTGYDFNDKYVWSDPYLGALLEEGPFSYKNYGKTQYSPKWFSTDGSGNGVVSNAP